MKMKVPAREVEVCDRCKTDRGYLATCIVCREKYCLMCKPVQCGCMVEADVCRKCYQTPMVQKAMDKCAKKIVPLVRARDKELRAMRRAVRKYRKENE